MLVEVVFMTLLSWAAIVAKAGTSSQLCTIRRQPELIIWEDMTPFATLSASFTFYGNKLKKINTGSQEWANYKMSVRKVYFFLSSCFSPPSPLKSSWQLDQATNCYTNNKWSFATGWPSKFCIVRVQPTSTHCFLELICTPCKPCCRHLEREKKAFQGFLGR